MIDIIRQVCQKAGCQPKDLVVEWTPTTGARLIATNAQGVKTSLNVLCGLDRIAHAIYLCANGQEHLYPAIQRKQAAIDAKTKEWLAENNDTIECQHQWQPAEDTEESLENDWRQFTAVGQIVDFFPRHPAADDLIDLYLRNKKINSPQLEALLKKHSR